MGLGGGRIVGNHILFPIQGLKAQHEAFWICTSVFSELCEFLKLNNLTRIITAGYLLIIAGYFECLYAFVTFS